MQAFIWKLGFFSQYDSGQDHKHSLTGPNSKETQMPKPNLILLKQMGRCNVLTKGIEKVCHTSRVVLVGWSHPFLRLWARRWINHSSLWRMASVMTDLWLPSQAPGINALWLVSIYILHGDRGTYINNLPKGIRKLHKDCSHTALGHRMVHLQIPLMTTWRPHANSAE